MGGRKQRKKKIHDKDKKEAYVSSNHSVPARNIRKADLGAVILGCTNSTINECLSKKLFGLPALHYSYIKNITKGLALFLFNYSDRKLHGIFEAASHGQMNIDKYAWVAGGDSYTSYPAQVRVRVRLQCHPLSENNFQPIIAMNYYESNHFYFELDLGQTNNLISLFQSSPVNSSSLPVSAKGQAYNAMHNWEEVGFDHTEKAKKTGSTSDTPLRPGLSYASALCGNNTSTTATATSSLPTGNWSGLFKGQSSSESTNDYKCPIQASSSSFSASDSSIIPQSSWVTNSPAYQSVQVYEDSWDDVVDEFPQNQEYQDKADFLQANTCEDSQLLATTTDAECTQTWVSHLNPEANTTTDELQLHQEYNDSVNFLQANTWEESIATGTDEVDQGQTNAPSSSDQPLDYNPDSKQSLCDKENESSVEEKHEKDSSLFPNTAAERSENLESLVIKLNQEVEALKVSQLKHTVKVNMLEQELGESKLEIQSLRNRIGLLEFGSPSIVDPTDVNDQLLRICLSNFVDSVFIFGGYDGSSWLTTLDSYSPYSDIKRSLSPMSFVKKYASAATLNGELYHFGGEGAHTVESFSLAKNQWVSRPPLYRKNIHVAGASIKDRLFVVGGGNGHQCSSEVQYLDLNIGKWLPTQSMQNMRLAPAAAELNNSLYVTGGYDGRSYLSSVERFDPREETWCKLQSMNARKGCHSMVVLNEKLYTIGGHDGDKYIPTVEYLDTRMGSWVDVEPMNVSRGNFGAFVLGEKLYAIGGLTENNEVLDIVECYKEGSCWEIADLKAIGKRSQFSAIVMK
ncbi:hypothetical protein Ccrd_011623 [Cynara cardunculus var. scolymus]|uniref:DCD domain-containing protein n=2 Tax=Cynara cardunculus var. scolymus TaxID=59895 RepID=A0A103YJ25_CYNCS|nr:hypothetical protein Ccrd_011623 [Cynara cardunculus var. scolymus]